MNKKLNENVLPNDYTIANELIKALYEKKPLSGPDGVFTQLLKPILEHALQGEIDAHMLEQALDQPGNRKNGTSQKTVKSAHGCFELDTPRDRLNTFEPQLVKKRQTVLTEEIDTKILSLYSLGTGYEDIASHIADIYGVSVSAAAISAITDKLIPQIADWRSRPLESVYPIVFLDAMFFKAREEGAVKTKALYNIMGIDREGKKDVLGFYTCESEGASFWLGVLNDLKARGVQDILIVCIDGLKGFAEAVATAFPKAEIQSCIVHQIRNSIKLVASKDQKVFMADLKQVYQAPSKAVAEQKLAELSSKWTKYQAAIGSWINHWEQLSTYFKYPQQIRKLIYTTNPIEGFHRQVRKYTKTKGAFTGETALLKLVYCAINQISRK